MAGFGVTRRIGETNGGLRFRLRAPRSRLREARFGGRSKVGGLESRRSSPSERRRVANPRYAPRQWADQ